MKAIRPSPERMSAEGGLRVLTGLGDAVGLRFSVGGLGDAAGSLGMLVGEGVAAAAGVG